ncbi:hypothetical protein FOA52_015534 [Chlamydomonas sp. UWO 241]|nr:hypothetical protein FOA52_015534 [Chlamydomonas sp. UWO 241]
MERTSASKRSDGGASAHHHGSGHMRIVRGLSDDGSPHPSGGGARGSGGGGRARVASDDGSASSGAGSPSAGHAAADLSGLRRAARELHAAISASGARAQPAVAAAAESPSPSSASPSKLGLGAARRAGARMASGGEAAGHEGRRARDEEELGGGEPGGRHLPMLVYPALPVLLHAARACALPPPPPAPVTTMLAKHRQLPADMQRERWCIGDYTLQEKLYKGYASVVYRAHCRRSGATVVLKIYSLDAVIDLYKFQIFREVWLHARLNHPNIILLLAAFQEDDQVVLVEEFADGCDLLALLQQHGGRLSEQLAVQVILAPFIRALDYMHSMGMLHRDIKPENILFTSGMVLKLGDFGLAIDTHDEQPVTRAGTLDYMAPEVLRCPYKSRPDENKDRRELQYGAGADAWAVGVLCFELLSGFPPFYDPCRQATEAQILGSGMPRLSSRLSLGARDFITRALRRGHPDARLSVHQMLHHPWVAGAGRLMPAHHARALVQPQQAQQAQQAQQQTQQALQAPAPPAPRPRFGATAQRVAVAQLSSAALPTATPPPVSPPPPPPRGAAAGPTCSLSLQPSGRAAPSAAVAAVVAAAAAAAAALRSRAGVRVLPYPPAAPTARLTASGPPTTSSNQQPPPPASSPPSAAARHGSSVASPGSTSLLAHARQSQAVPADVAGVAAAPGTAAAATGGDAAQHAYPQGPGTPVGAHAAHSPSTSTAVQQQQQQQQPWQARWASPRAVGRSALAQLPVAVQAWPKARPAPSAPVAILAAPATTATTATAATPASTPRTPPHSQLNQQHQQHGEQQRPALAQAQAQTGAGKQEAGVTQIAHLPPTPRGGAGLLPAASGGSMGSTGSSLGITTPPPVAVKHHQQQRPECASPKAQAQQQQQMALARGAGPLESPTHAATPGSDLPRGDVLTQQHLGPSLVGATPAALAAARAGPAPTRPQPLRITPFAPPPALNIHNLPFSDSPSERPQGSLRQQLMLSPNGSGRWADALAAAAVLTPDASASRAMLRRHSSHGTEPAEIAASCERRERLRDAAAEALAQYGRDAASMARKWRWEAEETCRAAAAGQTATAAEAAADAHADADSASPPGDTGGIHGREQQQAQQQQQMQQHQQQQTQQQLPRAVSITRQHSEPGAAFVALLIASGVGMLAADLSF